MRKLSLTAIGSLHIYGNYVSYKRLRTTNTNFTFEVPLCLLNKLVSPKHLLHIYFKQEFTIKRTNTKTGMYFTAKSNLFMRSKHHYTRRLSNFPTTNHNRKQLFLSIVFFKFWRQI